MAAAPGPRLGIGGHGQRARTRAVHARTRVRAVDRGREGDEHRSHTAQPRARVSVVLALLVRSSAVVILPSPLPAATVSSQATADHFESRRTPAADYLALVDVDSRRYPPLIVFRPPCASPLIIVVESHPRARYRGRPRPHRAISPPFAPVEGRGRRSVGGQGPPPPSPSPATATSRTNAPRITSLLVSLLGTDQSWCGSCARGLEAVRLADFLCALAPCPWRIVEAAITSASACYSETVLRLESAAARSAPASSRPAPSSRAQYVARAESWAFRSFAQLGMYPRDRRGRRIWARWRRATPGAG